MRSGNVDRIDSISGRGDEVALAAGCDGGAVVLGAFVGMSGIRGVGGVAAGFGAVSTLGAGVVGAEGSGFAGAALGGAAGGEVAAGGVRLAVGGGVDAAGGSELGGAALVSL